MQKVREYEQHFAECRQIAAAAKDRRYKRQLEDMAALWDRLAAERRQGIIENEPDSVVSFFASGGAYSPIPCWSL
jgi:hypothetical protein